MHDSELACQLLKPLHYDEFLSDVTVLKINSIYKEASRRCLGR